MMPRRPCTVRRRRQQLWDQLHVRARVWAFVLLSDVLGVGGRVLAVLDEPSGRPKIGLRHVLGWGLVVVVVFAETWSG